MLIEIGLLNYMHLIFVILPIVIEIQNFLITLLNYESNLDKNNVYKIFKEYLSMGISGIIIHLIIKIYSKTTKEKENEKYKKAKKKELKMLEDSEKHGNKKINLFQTIELENIHKKRIEKRNKFLFLLLITYSHIFGCLIQYYFNVLKIEGSSTQLSKNISVLVLSIFLILFSIIFLRFSLHRHQFFSLLIIFICSIVFLSETLIYKDNASFIGAIYAFINLSMVGAFFCLYDVLGKKYLNIYIDGVYLFLFKIGLIGGISFLIYDIIAYLCNVDAKYQGVIRAFKEAEFLNFVIKFINSSIFDLGQWLIIYYFSPCHFIILKVLLEFAELIITLIKDENNENKYETGQKITFVILYPLLIFAILVFNEILIIRCGTLEYNTKKYILKREEIEGKLIGNLYGNDDDNGEDFNEDNKSNID